MNKQTHPSRTRPRPSTSGASSLQPVLSVVIPVYQECRTIRSLLEDLRSALLEWGRAHEVIVVDDGSSDGTGTILQSAEEQFDHLRVLRHPYNKGNGSALKTGIRAAEGEWIACMDGDGQHVPGELLKLLERRGDYELVVGARDRGSLGPWHRRWANRLYNGLSSWIARFDIRDLTSGFRLYRARVLKRYVDHFPPRFSCEVTGTLIFLKAGYNVTFVPVRVRARQGGSSKIRPFRDGGRFFVIIFKIVLMFEPLRVFLPIASTSFFLATGLVTYAIWEKGRLFIPNAAVILSVMGVIVLLMGMISEQIATLQLTARRSHLDG